ncbi:MAG: hypothetical protein ACR2KZ_04820, partial [Segetibacter sp.]
MRDEVLRRLFRTKRSVQNMQIKEFISKFFQLYYVYFAIMKRRYVDIDVFESRNIKEGNVDYKYW